LAKKGDINISEQTLYFNLNFTGNQYYNGRPIQYPKTNLQFRILAKRSQRLWTFGMARANRFGTPFIRLPEPEQAVKSLTCLISASCYRCFANAGQRPDFDSASSVTPPPQYRLF